MFYFIYSLLGIIVHKGGILYLFCLFHLARVVLLRGDPGARLEKSVEGYISFTGEPG